MALAGYSTIVSGRSAYVPLRTFDPQFYTSKTYRDSVLSSNILRKATQLVAQIEAASVKKPNPIAAILANVRGSFLDYRA